MRDGAADGLPAQLAEIESEDLAIAVLALEAEPTIDDRTKAAARRGLRSPDPAVRAGVWRWFEDANRYLDLLDEGDHATLVYLARDDGRLPLEFTRGIVDWLPAVDLREWKPARFAGLLEVVRRIDPGDAPALTQDAARLASRLVDPNDPVPAGRDVGLALAELAVKGSESKDAAILDLLACALALCDRWEEAADVERRAVELGMAQGAVDTRIAARLERFKIRAAGKGAAK